VKFNYNNNFYKALDNIRLYQKYKESLNYNNNFYKALDNIRLYQKYKESLDYNIV
jgi:cell fate (sporulation/competence/biofilm development) regulator YmcA (YheA/YmcA/DUF963 family)